MAAPGIEKAREDRMNRSDRLFPVVVLFLAVMFASTVHADNSLAAEDRLCPPPNVRTNIRPHENGPPIKIEVGVNMIDLMEIDDISQTMTADFAVSQRWVDPRLAHLEGCEIPLTDIWTPDLTIINSGRKFRNRPKKAVIGPGGQVSYLQRYSGTFATYHKLNHFPFDDQVFRVSLFSPEWSEKDVQLIADSKETGMEDRLNISDWTINSVEGVIDRQQFKSSGTSHSLFDFIISAHRIRGYYIWKVILPLCLIVAMSWCVFWINPAQYGPQIGLSATSMLTLIAFIFATTNMVPRLGYLTLLDRFIVGSTILVFLALVESLAAVYLVSRDKERLAMRIDVVSRWVFPIVFVVFFFVVFGF